MYTGFNDARLASKLDNISSTHRNTLSNQAVGNLNNHNSSVRAPVAEIPLTSYSRAPRMTVPSRKPYKDAPTSLMYEQGVHTPLRQRGRVNDPYPAGVRGPFKDDAIQAIRHKDQVRESIRTEKQIPRSEDTTYKNRFRKDGWSNHQAQRTQREPTGKIVAHRDYGLGLKRFPYATASIFWFNSKRLLYKTEVILIIL